MQRSIFTFALIFWALSNIMAQHSPISNPNAVIPAFPYLQKSGNSDKIQIGDSAWFKENTRIGKSTGSSLDNIPGAKTMIIVANQDGFNKPEELSDSGHSISNTHSIVVPEGWSGLSSYLIPTDPNIENLFLPYQDQLIILYNQQGVYYPAQQLNTLVNWDAQSGYIAKFSQETSIEFSGQPVQTRILNLTTGWNLIPVLADCPVNTDTLFENADVVVVKEVAGWNLFWPEMGINTLDELLPGNAYYVLMNSPAVITFPNGGTTPWQCGDLLVDTRDGKSYATVPIGTQCWMAQNLNVGTRIDGVQNSVNDVIIEKYCYNNLETNCDIYGGLYQWDEMMEYSTVPGVQGICPTGWHLPADAEWTNLTIFLGGQSVAGGKMKETGTIHWNSPNTGATNSSGFTAIPGGIRLTAGSFSGLSYFGYWWASTYGSGTTAWYGKLSFDGASVNFGNLYDKKNGLLVRCLRNETLSYYLNVYPPNQGVNSSSGTTTFEVFSNTSWTVAESVSWLSVSPASGSNNGTLTVTYDANAGSESRTGQISIIADGGMPVVNVTVSQAGFVPVLNVTPLNQDVTLATGTTTFDVTSNTSWTVTEIASWLSVSPASGSNNGTLTVACDENLATESRIGQITITADGGTPVVNVTVTQAGTWACGQPITDTRDGKTYTTVQIGTQCWMQQNLNVGTQIDGINEQSNNGTIEKYCYNNLETNCDIYGGLYQWNEMMNYSTTPAAHGICPTNWHVPTDAEWTTLTTYVSSQTAYHCNSNSTYIGKSLAATTTWNTSTTTCAVGNDPVANNATGFTGLSGGDRSWNSGSFSNMGTYGRWWSSSEYSSIEAWYQYLRSNTAESYRSGIAILSGITARCLRDVTMTFYIYVTPLNQNVTATAGTTTFYISSNLSWSVTENVSWLSVSPASGSNNGTITVIYDENSSAESRIGQITITAPGGTPIVNVTFTQAGFVPVLTVTPLNQYVTLAASTTTFDVTSNLSWIVDESVSWFSVSPENGINNGTISVTYDANSSAESRIGQITIAATDGTPVVNVTVNQAGILVCGQPITDTRDGKTYTTVQIGTQCWIAQNLNVGTLISGTSSQTNNATIEKYCYNNLESNCDVYGGLYQWNEMMQYTTTPGWQGICPNGWHLPTDSEWTNLTTFLGGQSVAGGKMKETGTTHWLSPNTGATNSSGFTGLPGGYRADFGSFGPLGYNGLFWSSTVFAAGNAWYRGMDYNIANVNRSWNYMGTGHSVRCLTDEAPSSFLHATPTNQDVTASAGTTTFEVSSNLSWTVTESLSWLSVSPASGSANGTLTVTYDANAGTESRIGQITITADGGTPVVNVTITQAGAPPFLTVTPSNQNVTFVAGTTTFEVASNTSWTISEGVSWLSVSPASGSNNGTLTVTYDANVGTDSRIGHITITAAGGTPVVNVTVTQPGAPPFLSVTPSNQNVTLAAGTTTFEVASNLSWTVAESVSWLTVSPASGSNNGTLTVTYDANTSSSRIGQITITAAGGAPVVNITVTQAGVSWACGSTISVNHIVGAVAPVTKTVTYGTVTNIPGATTKCWITSNLGADHQATAVSDATEASAGWYWQFNLKQGYKHDGTIRTPNLAWIYPINENSDWLATNDPCALELGMSWRIPTSTEWANVDASGNWATWTDPWNSGLKMHAAGTLNYNSGSLVSRGLIGLYWGSTQTNATFGGNLRFSSGYSVMGYSNDAYGFSLRCLLDETPSSFLDVNPPNQNISATAGTTTFDVTSNLSWTVTESDSWLSVSPASGSANGTLTVTYDANAGTDHRIGQITITADGGTPGVNVTVTQAGAPPFLTVTPSNQNGTFVAGTTNFEVASNTSWTVTESVSWLSVSPASGSANGTLTVTYDANAGTDSRIGQITITADGGTPVVNVTVTQAGVSWACGQSITDARDSKTYNTVQIGTQCWMAQNLNIGTRIAGTDEQTNNGSIEKYCYNNLETNCDIYGGLYQWNEMMEYSTAPGIKGICPAGWHLPIDNEYTALTTYLDGSSSAGGKMKTIGTLEAGTGLWYSPNTDATNSSGFSALPAGARLSFGNYFYSLGQNASLWSSTKVFGTYVWSWGLSNGDSGAGHGWGNESSGNSVRCISDESTSYFIDVTPSNQDVTAIASTTTFDVSANLSWTVAESVSWLSVSPSGGSENGTLTVTYDANSSTDHRIGQITVTAADGTQVMNVTITQAGTLPGYCGQPITDTRDGKTYTTVQIGTQCWMAQNLNIGTRIAFAGEQTNNSTIEKYCYNNLETNCDVYGGLYQWNEMMAYSITPHVQGICPVGWHLPTDAEWTILTTYVSSQTDYCCNSNGTFIGKSLSATTNWSTSTITCAIGNDLATNNASGFSCLPGGYRYIDGTIDNLGTNGEFWSSTEASATNAWWQSLYYSSADVFRAYYPKGVGFSARCLSDDTPSFLNVTPTNQNVSATTGSTTINVSSNLSWIVSENVSWLSVSPASGSANATLTVTYDANSSLDSRIGQITITADDGTPLVNVTVTQAGAPPFLTVTPSNQNVTLAAGTTTFEVASNTSWTVAESVSWLSVSPASGSANGTLTVTYDANAGTDSRIGQITITADGGTPVVNVTVTQAGFVPVLTVTPLNQNVTPAAGTTTFEVASNTSWAVTESVSWFSVSPASGSNNGTLTVTYDANDGTESRIGQITITAEGGAPVVHVTVTQAGTTQWVCGQPMVDSRDNKTYTTVPIGTQCWMSQNLDIGTRIDGTVNPANNATIEKYCYDNLETNCDIFGGLYQWDEMMQYSTTPGVQGICPSGWHLPSDVELTSLTTFVRSQAAYRCNSNSAYIGKSLAANTNWNISTATCAVGNNLAANNATGFTAMPGGFRQAGVTFYDIGYSIYFWSSTVNTPTDAFTRTMQSYGALVGRSYQPKDWAMSVRCLKDN